MPRKSRTSIPFTSAPPSNSVFPSTAKSHSNRKRKHRTLNAFATAIAQSPERTKVQEHRLGENPELDAEEPRHKRRRFQDEDEEDEVEDEEDEVDDDGASNARRLLPKKVRKVGLDEASGVEDVREGSDGEGREWQVGVGALDASEDESVDSDEAFGSGDEEKFEGFQFQGSKAPNVGNRRTGGKKKMPHAEMRLSDGEDKNEDYGDDESDDCLGSAAVDLAQILDAGMEDEKMSKANTRNRKRDPTGALESHAGIGPVDEAGSHANLGNFDGFIDDSDREDMLTGNMAAAKSGSESESDEPPSDPGNDDNDTDKLEQLQEAIDCLPKSDQDENKSASNVSPDAKRMIAALKNMSNLDPALTRSMKRLARNQEDSSQGDKPNGTVQVPLPKRQRDRIDRTAAYTKAKDTLNRWTDTVKHNRRAEHLFFPLKDPTAQEAQGTTRLLPIISGTPQSDLESAIQRILHESGLAGPGAKSEERQIQETEELQINKMPLEEVMARRAELRKKRDLLFREEQRAKRIKKIKSKAYRRVHRKDREKAVQEERALMAAAGLGVSDDEREEHDRRRAEERMGTRHKESRWAKGMKQSGRVAWDEEARSGVTDMARRNEELRQRVQGHQSSSEDGNSIDDDREEDDLDLSDEEGQRAMLRRQLDEVESATSEPPGQSRLGSMKFMQRAEARKKQANDEMTESLRRELAGEESQNESEPSVNVGRRSFGPKEEQYKLSKEQKQGMFRGNELEEGSLSEDENFRPRQFDESRADKSITGDQSGLAQPKPVASKRSLQSFGRSGAKTAQQTLPLSNLDPASNIAEYDARGIAGEITQSDDRTSIRAPSNRATWPTVTDPTTREPARIDFSDDGNEADQQYDAAMALNPTNEDLVKAAFGVDDTVEQDFAEEKKEAAESEDDQFVDKRLPGWGSWTGAGVATKKRSSKTKIKTSKVEGHSQSSEWSRFLVREKEGVKPEHRRDAKLKDVILSEKRVKKNVRYMASTLPHPFESRTQYERSLRIPVGPEWTTKESFQRATKPRVLVKQGIIGPMERTLL